jgi:hypothetical protein
VLPPSLRQQKKVSGEKFGMDRGAEIARIQALSKPTGVRKVKKKNLWPLKESLCKNTEMREIMVE